MQKSVSIIIPNYNGKHLLEAYLPSVFEAIENAGVEYELIIVDDHSTDNSVAFIQQIYPSVKLLVNAQNAGFSYTCNRGIQVACYELILLLNSDVKLTPGYFFNQWKYFEGKDTFGVMGCIMQMKGNKIEDAARLLYYSGCRIRADRFYFSRNDVDTPCYTAYLSGANALIDAEKLKKLGGFDELFSPFYSEDLDLSLRAWELGWKCYYEHDSVCYHHVSSTTKTQNKKRFVKSIYYRNRFALQKLHLIGWRALFWPVQLLFIEFIPKMLIGNFWILKSFRDYLNLSKKITVSKQKFSKLKKEFNSSLTVDDIVRLFPSGRS